MKSKIIFCLLSLVSLLAVTACLEEDPNWAEGTPSPTIALIDLRFLSRGSEPVALTPEKIGGASQIVGVVVSDADAGNAPGGNLVIQNRRRGGLRGLVLQVSGRGYAPGDSVAVRIEGASLARVNGVLTLQGISPEQVRKVGQSRIFTTPVTVSQLKANP